MVRFACVVGVVLGLVGAWSVTYRPSAQPVAHQAPVQVARWGSLPGFPPSGGYCLDR
jgi:hypothetical protein